MRINAGGTELPQKMKGGNETDFLPAHDIVVSDLWNSDFGYGRIKLSHRKLAGRKLGKQVANGNSIGSGLAEATKQENFQIFWHKTCFGNVEIIDENIL